VKRRTGKGYRTLTDFLATLSPDVTVQSVGGRRVQASTHIATPPHLRRTEHDEQVAFVMWAR
jgi:hypothetical protein